MTPGFLDRERWGNGVFPAFGVLSRAEGRLLSASGSVREAGGGIKLSGGVRTPILLLAEFVPRKRHDAELAPRCTERRGHAF
jgi:hypothetical protein